MERVPHPGHGEPTPDNPASPQAQPATAQHELARLRSISSRPSRLLRSRMLAKRGESHLDLEECSLIPFGDEATLRRLIRRVRVEIVGFNIVALS